MKTDKALVKVWEQTKNPLDRAHLIKREASSSSIANVSEKLGIHITTVYQYRKLLELPKEVQLAVRDGEIGLASAVKDIKLHRKHKGGEPIQEPIPATPTPTPTAQVKAKSNVETEVVAAMVSRIKDIDKELEAVKRVIPGLEKERGRLSAMIEAHEMAENGIEVRRAPISGNGESSKTLAASA